jgi:ribosomal protein S18 acetylase RimI-like enzyme
MPLAIREAGPNDNEALIALAREAPMQGAFSLRIEREPDFFGLQHLRGAGPVLVAESDRQVVGCIAIALRSVYVEGIPETVAYVGDLKVHPAFSGSRAALKLILSTADFIRARGVDLVVCVVAHGNERAFAVLLEGRCGTPKFHSLGRFQVYQLLPRPIGISHGSYEVREASVADAPLIRELVRRFNKSYQFAPAAGAEEGTLRRLVAWKDDELVATLSTFDPHHLKQTVVTRMPPGLGLAVRALRAVSSVVPLFSFPMVGEPVSMLYLRHLACRGDHHAALGLLVQEVRRQAFQQRYSFVSVGVHERDPLRRLFRFMPRYSFVSHALVTSLRGERGSLDGILSGVAMEDFALV